MSLAIHPKSQMSHLLVLKHCAQFLTLMPLEGGDYLAPCLRVEWPKEPAAKLLPAALSVTMLSP